MFRTTFVKLALVAGSVAALNTAAPQEPPRDGTYQIQSGSYREVGGFAGLMVYPLPRPEESFVSLMTDTGTGAAELTLFNTNQEAAFLKLTNGAVSGNTIQFHYPARHPLMPGWPAWLDFTVTNAAGHLWISGSITSAPPGPDIPYVFEHRDVLAVFMPVLSIRADTEVELRWSSAANQYYQVQFQPDLSPLVWTNLGGPVPGNGTTNSILDSLVPPPARRFYRILTLP